MVRKGTATWFVRATGKEDLATISVSEGKGLSGAAQAREAHDLCQEPFATTIGAKETMEKDETGKEVPAGKKAKLELRAVPSGVTLKTMPRDGNCLAHALGQGLTFLKQDEKQRPARLVRAEIHAYMVRKSAEFAGFWDGRNTSDEEGKLANFEEYLKEMAGDSKYLGCLELTAASRAFDLTLIVVPVAAKDPPTRLFTQTSGGGARVRGAPHWASPKRGRPTCDVHFERGLPGGKCSWVRCCGPLCGGAWGQRGG